MGAPCPVYCEPTACTVPGAHARSPPEAFQIGSLVSICPDHPGQSCVHWVIT